MLNFYNTKSGMILQPLPKKQNKKTQEELSQGVLKDFMVLNFCGALIEISYTNPDGAIIRNTDNTVYKENKRIERRLREVRKHTSATIDAIGSVCNHKQQLWIKKRLTVVGTALQWLERHDININLELLALYVLFVNFDDNERDKMPVHPLYKWYQDSTNYMDTNADLIGNLLSDKTETDMFLLAYDLVSILKK